MNEICRGINFTLADSHKEEQFLETKLQDVDKFSSIALNQNTKIVMRGRGPYVKLYKPEESCLQLRIHCI